MSSRRTRSLAVAAIVGALFAVSNPRTATASVQATDDSGPVFDGIGPGVDYVPGVDPEADARRALYTAYGEAVQGRLDASALTEAVETFEDTTGESVTEGAAPIPELAKVTTGMVAGKAATTAATTAHSLAVPYYSQGTDNNYCGPATAKMILAWEGHNTSAYNPSHNNTESRLATSDYLKTDLHGATNWGTKDMELGFDKFYGSNYLLQDDSPSVSSYVGTVVSHIDGFDAPAVGTHEPAGGYHYNGHPAGQTIRHWLVVKGYTTNAVGTTYLDSSTSIWTGVDQQFNYGNSAFVPRYITGYYGIAS
ncbi:C39 family peptidase [Aeromicrobium fastidiosum]|uniref:Peptidase C39-like domain-containing protein n=1 Tax=Aeromicrobium fastidiosum TaxID=52699 RepID=A0A641AKG4_9ACTN|nr:C39 family peptidase [Aeromicrobium fastidiosum]KAA1374915.1 hypothetical protein ESP62_016220 [Aeromicrobium fastidiosum]MBP2390513.1 hypothetical protein [Aeromicrobium fastidiosum]